MLKEAVPAVQRVTVVWDDRIGALQFGATQAAARVFDIVARSAPIRHEREAEEVVRHALTAKSQAIVMLTSPIVLRAQRRIAELAAQHRLPTVSGFSTFPDDGGLLETIRVWFGSLTVAVLPSPISPRCGARLRCSRVVHPRSQGSRL
jgi:hypothetical protein